MRLRRRRSERGAAAVEFAIVLPLLIAILCGTIDWGYYFFTREVVINAARHAARVGTLPAPSGSDQDTTAREAATQYLTDALGSVTPRTIETGKTPAGVCPPSTACVLITYELGGSVTGLLGSLVPAEIVGYAQMRR
jgi:Flp pilus assembly protein TadG